MPMYEFRCKHGHVTEDLCRVGTVIVPCGKCLPERTANGHQLHFATRILSPTRTNFRFNDSKLK